MKWNSYMFFQQEEVSDFWKSYYAQRNAKLLFVMGKGFDPRMNNTLKKIFEDVAYQSLDCMAVDFPAQEETDGDEFYKLNVAEFETLMNKKGVSYKTITIDAKLSWDNRIKSMLRQLNQIAYTDYTDIILDVSAIPCAYYYNIAKLLYDKTQYDQTNFFITVSENVEIDKLIKKKYNEETITPLYNFRASYGMESVFNPINIFVPLMGEDKKEHLKLVYDTFHPKEVCPVLPFPSKEPGRSDQLLLEYNDFLTDTLKVEPQNLLYAPERDPFELYNRLEKLMQDYKDTLKLIDGQICFGFALLTSKLLALGVLLIGLKYENEVQVYNVNSSKYDIADKKKIFEANEHSEPFMMWINGEPYK